MQGIVHVGAVVLCAVTVAACAGAGPNGSDTGSSATAAPNANATTTTTEPPPPIVSPGLLDTGPYPKVPRPPLGPAGNPSSGAVADAQQMAGFVVGPWEVDEGLITPYLNAYYVINAPNALQQLGPEGIPVAAREHGMINGFASAREQTDKTSMINAVLRFPDPTSATAASTAMAEASANIAVQGASPVPTPIPGHPGTVASTYPFTARANGQKRSTIRSFTPHGPYVFMQFVQSVDGVDAAATLIAKAIDQQGPLIDQFKPAAPGALAEVPLDPTGLLARTLPAPVEAGTAKNAVYSDRGAENFQSNPIASVALFKDNGITEVAMGLANVYQTRDASTAKKVTDSFNAEVATQGTAEAPGVPALPNSHCRALANQFYCVAPAGEYAIEVVGAQLPDVQRQVAAQYVMLTAK